MCQVLCQLFAVFFQACIWAFVAGIMALVTANQPFLFVAYDRLGSRQAGPALRSLALAKELAAIGGVEVVFEGEPPDDTIPGVTFIHRDEFRLDSFSRYKAAIAPPLVAMVMPELLESDIPIVIDLFDPIVWENLELYSDQPELEQQFQHERHLSALLAALFRGDFFMVAVERQLDLFTGALMVLNRINPSTWKQGAGPGQFVGLVPFGIPDEPPPAPDTLSMPKGYETDGPLVVWGGGMWDWLRPELVVEAWPSLLESHPNAVLAFPGTEHPNPHVPEMAAVKRVKKLSVELGVQDHMRFGGWLARREYLGLLARSACGVSAHAPGLEARYAARTRFLDAIWMGLPMVVTEGDEYAEYIADRGLGEVVRETGPKAFAAALRRTIDSGKESLQDRITNVRRSLSWQKQAQPLLKWADDPKITHGPGLEFFRNTAGETSPRGRPSDPGSLLRRLLSRLSR